MIPRRRTVVVAALAVAAVALGAAAVAGLLDAGGPAAPAEPPAPEVAGGPAVHTDPDYWTEDRLRGAEPAPMPAPPEGR
ncbi:hypothetical protein [Amycolatopsis tolypomycina]|uniref:hypothetical protein n=1 Tax=Amycolatopsis tolypomycina TaxID=208445 RepID=UPI0033A50CEA